MVRLLLYLQQGTEYHPLSPLRKTQILQFLKRPVYLHELIYFHSLLQQPPGTKMNLICKAKGCPDVPTNIKKEHIRFTFSEVLKSQKDEFVKKKRIILPNEAPWYKCRYFLNWTQSHNSLPGSQALADLKQLCHCL